MSRIPSKLKPVNRHLVIMPHVEKNETNSGVLVPEDFEMDADRYIKATVLDISEDCNPAIRQLWSPASSKEIIVERSMVQEIKLHERPYYVILENYVVGILRGPDVQ